jgi:hypothetical protein
MKELLEYKEKTGLSYKTIGEQIGGYDRAYIHRAFHSPGVVRFDVFMSAMRLVNVPNDVAKKYYAESKMKLAQDRTKKSIEKMMS